MITYPFEYKRAGSVDEALSLLAQHGDEAKLLAGGHSLIPTMKLRLAAPSVLIDVSGIEALQGITNNGTSITVGAMATHRSVETSDVVKSACPALAEVAAQIGDPQVRNKGTIGGSLAHADPAADYPALVLALNATVHARGASGERSIGADDYFQGLFETALHDDEMITAVSFPVSQSGTGAAYAKAPNPASRYAVVGVAAQVSIGADGTCTSVRVGITGAASSAFRAGAIEQALQGKAPTAANIAAAADQGVDAGGLLSDLSGSAGYRAHLCTVLAKKALSTAAGRAG